MTVFWEYSLCHRCVQHPLGRVIESWILNDLQVDSVQCPVWRSVRVEVAASCERADPRPDRGQSSIPGMAANGFGSSSSSYSVFDHVINGRTSSMGSILPSTDRVGGSDIDIRRDWSTAAAWWSGWPTVATGPVSFSRWSGGPILKGGSPVSGHLMTLLRRVSLTTCKTNQIA